MFRYGCYSRSPPAQNRTNISPPPDPARRAQFAGAHRPFGEGAASAWDGGPVVKGLPIMVLTIRGIDIIFMKY